MRIVSDATRAIARSRLASSRVRRCGAGRAITRLAPGGCSSGAAAAAHAPTPGTSSDEPSSPASPPRAPRRAPSRRGIRSRRRVRRADDRGYVRVERSAARSTAATAADASLRRLRRQPRTPRAAGSTTPACSFNPEATRRLRRKPPDIRTLATLLSSPHRKQAPGAPRRSARRQARYRPRAASGRAGQVTARREDHQPAFWRLAT